jgi:hypothetical protein
MRQDSVWPDMDKRSRGVCGYEYVVGDSKEKMN